MQRIKEILTLPSAGASVEINGWVRTRRDGKGFSFYEVNDGSCLSGIQAVIPGDLPNYDSELSRVTTGSSVRVRGVLVDSPGQGQKYEIRAEDVHVYGMAPADFPLQKKKHSL